MLASVLAAALVSVVIAKDRDEHGRRGATPIETAKLASGALQRRLHPDEPAQQEDDAVQPPVRPQPALAIAVLGLSGFAALVHEIAWTRILALVLGPTTYAFAATLAAVVAGVAIGSGAGTWLVGRSAAAHTPDGWPRAGRGAVTIVITSALAGGYVPRVVRPCDRGGARLVQRAAAAGHAADRAAHPADVHLPGRRVSRWRCRSRATRHTRRRRRFGLVYAVNTVGSVAGTLAAGFVLIPWLGLPTTLAAAAFVLVVASMLDDGRGDVSPSTRNGGYAAVRRRRRLDRLSRRRGIASCWRAASTCMRRSCRRASTSTRS